MARRVRDALDLLPAKVALGVRADRSAYSPGDTLDAVVTAGPADGELAIHGGVVGLDHELEYTYEVWTGERTKIKTKSDRRTAVEQRFTGERQLRAGEVARWQVSLQVPDSPATLGTASGEIVASRWFVGNQRLRRA